MAIDTVIKNCKVVKPNGIFSTGVGIENGKIALLVPDAYLPSAKRTIDAKGNYVLPGLVDAHTHLSWSPKRSDFAPTVHSETKSFAAGGCTTIVHMLSGKEDLLEQAKGFAEAYQAAKGYTDIAFSAQIISLDQIKQFRQVVAEGITAFKFYMPYRVGQPTVKDLPQIDDGLMYLGFEEIARLAKEGHNVHARVHCENIEIFSRLKARFIERGIEPGSWTEARPNFIETESITRVAFLGQVTGCPVCIIHISTKEGIDIVSKARGDGINIVAETCPQYLTLNVDNTDKLLAKVDPPIRHKEDNEKLWEGVNNGIISLIGTDHAPPSSRTLRTDLWSARLGFPIAEYWLTVLLSEGVNKGRITLEKVAELSSYNPAKFYGLTPRKGMIEVGADADLVIVDLEKETIPGDKPAYSGYDFNCWAGWHFKGCPVLTMLGGEVIMEEGKILGTSGNGEYVPSRSK